MTIKPVDKPLTEDSVKMMLDRLKEYNQQPKDYILWYNPSDFTKEFMKQFESKVDIVDSFLVPKGQCVLARKEDLRKACEPNIFECDFECKHDDSLDYQRYLIEYMGRW